MLSGLATLLTSKFVAGLKILEISTGMMFVTNADGVMKTSLKEFAKKKEFFWRRQEESKTPINLPIQKKSHVEIN